MDYSNWITAGANVVTAAGIVFLWLQLKLLHRQVEADHARSRRELTVRLMQHWSGAISPVISAARKLVSMLDDAQCRDLAQIKPFKTGASHRPLLETCLADILRDDPLQISGEHIDLTLKQVTRLRFLVADYLNETESVLLAWHLSIADRDSIEREFAFLYDERTGHDTLEVYRRASGKEAFPAIQHFLDRLRQKQDEERPKPPPPPF